MATKKHYWLHTMLLTVTTMLCWTTIVVAQNHMPMSNEMYGQMMNQGNARGMGYGGMGYGNMGMMSGGIGTGCGGMGMMGGGMGMMGGGMGMMGGGMSPMMQMFNLDAKQKIRIRQLMRDQRAIHLNTMNEIMDISDELADAYDKQGPKDAQAIGKLYNKMYDKQREMLEQSISMQNKIREVLTKEQQQIFDNMHRGGMGMMQ